MRHDDGEVPITTKRDGAKSKDYKPPSDRVSSEARPLGGSAQDHDTLHGEQTHRDAVRDQKILEHYKELSDKVAENSDKITGPLQKAPTTDKPIEGITEIKGAKFWGMQGPLSSILSQQEVDNI